MRPQLSLAARFSTKYIPEPNSGCWIWLGELNDSGYGIIDVKHGRKRSLSGTRIVRAHRLSYEMHKGGVSKDLFVCHSCDMPCCVNPDHLFLGTHQDNMDDMWRKNRRAPGGNKLKGIDHPLAKLSEDDVRAIRQTTGTLESVAKKYGVGKSTIWRVRRRKNWLSLQ